MPHGEKRRISCVVGNSSARTESGLSDAHLPVFEPGYRVRKLRNSCKSERKDKQLSYDERPCPYHSYSTCEFVPVRPSPCDEDEARWTNHDKHGL
ncbi:hypothetical protein KGM_215305 [Danaus plexippus plexippus]|uniref:Uncharacterized protein n=1 Tax=Danaus plexippus plexippus TaxID=278856 RepID=A0A212F5C7_DANPL|nr:hypothetical protein KGM_215305 [Danaus plexippus plexippus]